MGQSGGGERCPSGFERVVEQVAVGEVLEQVTVGIAPVVEDLAALDVSADAPGADIPMLTEAAAVLRALRDDNEFDLSRLRGLLKVAAS